MTFPVISMCAITVICCTSISVPFETGIKLSATVIQTSDESALSAGVSLHGNQSGVP